jgi:hypothetical protein
VITILSLFNPYRDGGRASEDVLRLPPVIVQLCINLVPCTQGIGIRKDPSFPRLHWKCGDWVLRGVKRACHIFEPSLISSDSAAVVRDALMKGKQRCESPILVGLSTEMKLVM